MFWTAFVWGLGVSCGGAFGVLLFFVLFYAMERWTGRAASKANIHDVNEKSLEALKERNEISREQVALLNDIAVSLDKAATSAD